MRELLIIKCMNILIILIYPQLNNMCTPLFQLLELINAVRHDLTDTILETIAQNNQSYCQLSYSIKKLYLDEYDPSCRIENCFVCKL